MRTTLLRALSALVIVSLLLTGCAGSKTVKVSGKFLKDGQPYSFPDQTLVTLIFMPVDKPEAPRKNAQVKPDLSGYEVEIPPGKYRVSFTAFPADFEPGSSAAPSGPMAKPPVPGSDSKGDGEVYDLTSAKKLDLPVPDIFALKK